MMFDARQIARGWLAVSLASGEGKEWPALYRTVRIEQHAHGALLVATDGYVLLHSFVPELGHEDDEHPGYDEAPIATATAIDYHGRAKGFLAHVLKLASRSAEEIAVRLRLNVLDTWTRDDTTRAQQLDGMEALAVVLEQPDVERIVLDVYDGSYPAWRAAETKVHTVKTAQLALNPEIVGRLAKLGKIHPLSLLGWSFGGENKGSRVEAIDSDPYVDGLVMPVRWDFTTNSPFVEPTPPEPDDEVAA